MHNFIWTDLTPAQYTDLLIQYSALPNSDTDIYGKRFKLRSLGLSGQEIDAIYKRRDLQIQKYCDDVERFNQKEMEKECRLHNKLRKEREGAEGVDDGKANPVKVESVDDGMPVDCGTLICPELADILKKREWWYKVEGEIVPVDPEQIRTLTLE
jgi:hypothetical protein